VSKAKLEAKAFEIFAPRKKESVTDWAESNVFLSERITEQAGLYRTSSHPYVREILNSFADPKVRKISLCWGSQTGKTTTIYVGVGYKIDQAPTPILWVWSNEKQARAFANDRFLPFCEDSEAIAKHLPKTNEGKIDRDRATALRIEFDRCSINMVGGGSQRNVRNFPVSLLVMDEIDSIAEPIRLEALARIKGRRSYLVVQSSSPLEEGSGIWSEYEQGDQRKYFVQCPHCRKWITLEWRKGKGEYNLRFPDEAKREDGTYDLPMIQAATTYACQKCGGDITDADKLRMLAKGKWKPTNKGAEAGVRSYHLSSLYSPTLTFADMLVRWFQSIGTIDGLRQFVTGWLAEPWRDENLSVSEEATHLLSGEYERGEMMGDFRLMAVDIQRAHLVYIVRGYDDDAEGTSYLIDHGYVPSWADIDAAFIKYDCSACVIDTGFGERTQEAYEVIYNRRRNFWACKGWKSFAHPYAVKAVDPFTGTGKAGKHRIRLLHIDVEVWGGELLKRRSKKVDGWHLYNKPDREYIKQLNAKFLIEKVDAKGKKKTEWRTRRHGQDHYWDCELYMLCLSKVVGLGNVTKKSSDEDNGKTGKEGNQGGGKKPPRQGSRGGSPRRKPSTKFW
jgi:phage terminase large subunit GpA-like protein